MCAQSAHGTNRVHLCKTIIVRLLRTWDWPGTLVYCTKRRMNYTHHTHTLYTLYTYIIHLHIHYTHYTHTLYTLYTYIIHIIQISVHPISVHPSNESISSKTNNACPMLSKLNVLGFRHTLGTRIVVIPGRSDIKDGFWIVKQNSLLCWVQEIHTNILVWVLACVMGTLSVFCVLCDVK